ncbi:MAG: hypothetical protein GC131_08385 [Alphaproteobacteria bacterium]|nr:hypothetical protein [Alphaproteobacteria bacterium]
MQQLNQFRFYDLGAKLHGLFNGRAQGNVADLFVPLTDAQKLLDALIKGEPVELTVARVEAVRLLTAISSLFEKYFIDQSSKQLRFPSSETAADPQEMMLLQTHIERFEQALAAEFARQTSYQAERRGIYATGDLVENASAAIPKTLLAQVPPAAQHELNESGKALSFGMGTAATMHMLRATELMVQKYFDMFSAALPSKAERNLATYLRKLASLAEETPEGKNAPDARVVQLLVQIKDRYRNPLVHIDAAVDIDDATMLFGIVTGAISQMAEALRAAGKGEKKAAGKQAATTEAVKDLLDEEEEIYDFRTAQAG